MKFLTEWPPYALRDIALDDHGLSDVGHLPLSTREADVIADASMKERASYMQQRLDMIDELERSRIAGKQE